MTSLSMSVKCHFENQVIAGKLENILKIVFAAPCIACTSRGDGCSGPDFSEFLYSFGCAYFFLNVEVNCLNQRVERSWPTTR